MNSIDIINEIFGNEELIENTSVFFTENSAEGYFSKAEFLKLVREFKGTWRLNHLKSLFDNMSLQKKLLSPPKLDYNGGSEVIWVRFGYGNLRQNLQIPNSGRLYDLIMDYANGRLRSVNTLEKLLIEAVQEEQQ